MSKRTKEHPDALEMLVVRSTGSEYLVQPVGQPHAEIISATLRGKFRLKGFKLTNPIAVGDHVRVTPDDRRIVELLPRDNYLLRASTHRENYSQILCSNIDQAVMVFSIEYPFTPLGFLDSFLVMCEAYHIPAVIVFNKVDRIEKDKHQFKLEDFSMTYHEIGYNVKHMVATDENYREKAEEILLGKRSFLCGKSGAGKSSLVNLVDPSLNLRTNIISDYSDKGQHTTTFAEWFWLQGGGSVIDAPGLNEFSVSGIEWHELQGYYPEMRARMNACKFNNCVHYHEPGCAVRAAVDTGDVAQSRYNTYVNMLTTLRPKLLKDR